MRWPLICAICLLGGVLLGGCAGDAVGEGRQTSASMMAPDAQSESNTDTPGSSMPTLPPGATAGAGMPASEPSVVTPGKKIETVPAAPPRTYAMFDLPDPFSGAKFTLTAQPYGWVPSPKEVSVSRLLLRVKKAVAAGGQTEAFADLTEQNALVWVDGGTAGADEVVEGGTYRVEVTVRPSGETGVLHATSIERTD